VPVVDLKVVDDHTVTGRIHLLFAPPGSYDVRLTTQDQQNAQLAGGVTIQR